MIQRQLKLRLNATQEQQLTTWLFHLTGVWNWAIRKIGLDAKDGIFYTQQGFHNLLADHGKKLGIPSHTLQGMLDTASTAWQRCYKKLAKKPRLKGQRNKLTSIPFPDPFRAPDGTHIHVPGLGHVRFHAQDIPQGRLKSGRIVKRASGWYLCLFIDAALQTIGHTGHAQAGIDPGFHHLLTLSSGEYIPHLRELEAGEERLAQAQRGRRTRLAARRQERLANRRKDRNHNLSRRLVADHQCLVWSKDRHRRLHGPGVRQGWPHLAMPSFAGCSPTSARQAVGSSSKCPHVCPPRPVQHVGASLVPLPWRTPGLSVRQWVCAVCGTAHDRDVNAARNTLTAGVGTTHERHRKVAPGIPAL